MKAFLGLLSILALVPPALAKKPQASPDKPQGNLAYCLQELDANCIGTVASTVVQSVLGDAAIRENDPRLREVARDCAILVNDKGQPEWVLFAVPSNREEPSSPAWLAAIFLAPTQTACSGKSFEIPGGVAKLGHTGDRNWVRSSLGRDYFLGHDGHLKSIETLYSSEANAAEIKPSREVPEDAIAELLVGSTH